MGDQARGSHPALAGAPRRLLGGLGLRPGAQAIATDVCVPLSRLAECVTETQRDIAEQRLVAPILGHVGDGNFHLTLLVDMADAAEVKAAKGLCERLVERALAMDGTSTGEHGVGRLSDIHLQETMTHSPWR